MFLYETALYRNSPIWVQEVAIAIVSYVRRKMREGPHFTAICEELQKTQWLSAEQLRDLQRERVLAVLQHATRNVPYYADLFARNNIHPGNIQDLDGISVIPLLTKRQVREAGRTLLSRGVPALLFRGATSGTTGLSLIGYRDLEAINYENAFIRRQLEWAGFRPGQRRAWFRGDIIVPVAQRDPPFWRRNRSDNMLLLSSFHLSEANAPAYIKALEAYDPVIIQAYPSSIAYLARHLASSGRTYGGQSLKGIVTSSETLGEEQRKIIEKTMGCKVFDWYGSCERVAAIGTCEYGRYHLLTDYSFVEVLPCGDGTSELVGTTFYNKAMPLVRYQIGDHIVVAKQDGHCDCGRAFPVVEEIFGRMDDYVVTPDGRRIGAMANMFDGLDNLLEGQVIQDSINTLRILVVPTHELRVEEIKDIEARARFLVGPEMKIVVEPVREVTRTRAGKVRMVIRNV